MKRTVSLTEQLQEKEDLEITAQQDVTMSVKQSIFFLNARFFLQSFIMRRERVREHAAASRKSAAPSFFFLPRVFSDRLFFFLFFFL